MVSVFLFSGLLINSEMELLATRLPSFCWNRHRNSSNGNCKWL